MYSCDIANTLSSSLPNDYLIFEHARHALSQPSALTVEVLHLIGHLQLLQQQRDPTAEAAHDVALQRLGERKARDDVPILMRGHSGGCFENAETASRLSSLTLQLMLSPFEHSNDSSRGEKFEKRFPPQVPFAGTSSFGTTGHRNLRMLASEKRNPSDLTFRSGKGVKFLTDVLRNTSSTLLTCLVLQSYLKLSIAAKCCRISNDPLIPSPFERSRRIEISQVIETQSDPGSGSDWPWTHPHSSSSSRLRVQQRHSRDFAGHAHAVTAAGRTAVFFRTGRGVPGVLRFL